ncbi:hypothetical protein EDB83DRAFT_2530434 [Lactarius deliciosus]|nr:hypothetical protein EDB83DRAFT_2530434 [Lactarius deliciosus]
MPQTSCPSSGFHPTARPRVDHYQILSSCQTLPPYSTLLSRNPPSSRLLSATHKTPQEPALDYALLSDSEVVPLFLPPPRHAQLPPTHSTEPLPSHADASAIDPAFALVHQPFQHPYLLPYRALALPRLAFPRLAFARPRVLSSWLISFYQTPLHGILSTLNSHGLGSVHREKLLSSLSPRLSIAAMITENMGTGCARFWFDVAESAFGLTPLMESVINAATDGFMFTPNVYAEYLERA